MATCNRLEIFWKRANTSVKSKTIIKSKLLYELECMQLMNAELSEINALQNTSLRRILGKLATFLDREQTNQRMYQEIRQIYHCNLEHFGDTWRKAKLRSDPLSQVRWFFISTT